MENSGGAYDVNSEGTSSSPGSSYVFSLEVVGIPPFTGMENIAYALSLCLVWCRVKYPDRHDFSQEGFDLLLMATGNLRVS